MGTPRSPELSRPAPAATAVLDAPAALPPRLPRPQVQRPRRRRALVARGAALALPAAALTVVGVVHAVGMATWPAYGNDDEGTYLARAWAVQTGLGAHHGPAPYTYWYDHPPFGWIQLSLWTWLTHTFRPGSVAVASGRADMLVYTLVSAALVYVIARRLGCSVPVAAGTVLVFGLSPLSVQYLRLVMLDTIALPWVLAAFALALSPRRRLWAFAAGGLCFAGGVLSKETYLILLPALLWLVWQRSAGPTRTMCLAVCSGVMAAVLAFYPLYAALKGELVPGHGHVSLIGAIEWQLSGRTGSGSVLRAGTDAHGKVLDWLRADPWLLGLGVAGLPVAFLVERLRPIGAAYATFVLMVLRPGYLPAAFVTGALPFAGLTAGTAVDALWRPDPALRLPHRAGTMRRRFALRPRRRPRRPHRPRMIGSDPRLPARRIVAGGLVAGAAVVLVPRWASGDRVAMTTDTTAAFSKAEAWVRRHVPRTATILVDDDVWIDLVDDGFRPSRVVWFWELESDPAVRARYPEGWRQMDYVVATDTIRVNVVSGARSVRSVVQALAHSTVVARFGTGTTWVSVRKVDPDRPGNPPWWLPGSGTLRPPTSGLQEGERL